MQQHAVSPRFAGKAGAGLRGGSGIAFVTINTDLAEKAAGLVPADGGEAAAATAMMISHVALAPALKAPLIAHFSIRRVPHHVLLGPDGAVLMNGPSFDWSKLDAMVGVVGSESEPPAGGLVAKVAPVVAAALVVAAPAPAFTLDLDEDF